MSTCQGSRTPCSLPTALPTWCTPSRWVNQTLYPALPAAVIWGVTPTTKCKMPLPPRLTAPPTWCPTAPAPFTSRIVEATAFGWRRAARWSLRRASAAHWGPQATSPTMQWVHPGPQQTSRSLQSAPLRCIPPPVICTSCLMRTSDTCSTSSCRSAYCGARTLGVTPRPSVASCLTAPGYCWQRITTPAG